MCGFAGFFSFDVEKVDNKEELLSKMADAIFHRGPDDGGIWYDPANDIGFSHRRLSIVDLSPAGHQPMWSANHKFIFIFNGEVYNHQEIRAEIVAQTTINWRGTSDTETLLAGFELWGISQTLKKCIGMFAFALWDVEKKELTLGRDRLGEKPLYYGMQGETFLFGSELKSLKQHPSFKGNINKQALSTYLKYGYVLAPLSIYNNIFKLKPGCILSISKNRKELQIESYWSIEETIKQGKNNPFKGTADEAVGALEILAKDAIAKQMLSSDVPLGAFLSGGVDSSTIVALMQSQSAKPIQTFSIGFEDDAYNEAVFAKDVAKHLKTDHTELYITAKDALDVVPLLPELYDEPFADTSQIPTYLVAKLAKKKVTVSLSGDAGDELFCGYNRYLSTAKYWDYISLLPSGLKKGISNGLSSVSPKSWDQIASSFSKKKNIGNKIHKGASVLTSNSVGELYESLISQHLDADSFVKNPENAKFDPSNFDKEFGFLSNIDKMMAYDLMNYLPDDILVKVDRAAMGVSLETRVPFLDHTIVEFAWSLPFEMKYRNGTGKWILREVLYKYVPKQLIERPKMGFGIPLESWLRGPLKDWSENLLNKERLEAEGNFIPEKVRSLWDEHQSEKKNWAKMLWNILMFQAWLEKNS